MIKFNYSLLKLGATLIILALVGCGGTVNLANKPARELYDEGMKAFNEKKYIRAIDYLQAVVFNHGGVSYVDTAQYHLALSYFSNRDYLIAGVEFNRLALNYPSSVYFEQSIFMRAICYFESTPGHYGLDQSDLEKAIKQFEDFIIDFPESAQVNDAREYLAVARGRMAKKYFESAVVYKRIGALKAAQKYYQIVLDDYTGSEFAPKALFETAEINMRLKKFSEAQSGFVNFITLYKEHELAEKATKLSREAAFKSGVFAFDKGEYGDAKEKFESFIKDYPNDDRVNDAKDYLIRIGDGQSLLSEDSHAES